MLARIENGAIIEERNLAIDDIPEHKRSLWYTVQNEGSGSVLAVVIDGAIVRKIFSPSVADIKTEAQRRIIALMGARDFSDCLVKQLNASMRAIELTNKKADGGALTEQESAESAMLQAIAFSIKHVRSNSNSLELTLPSDYTDDTHWE